jgi:hypothetical protein
MKKMAVACALVAGALAGCSMMGSGSGWTTLIDGEKGLENFDRFRSANWTATEGAIQATSGDKQPAYLVTRQSYKDFQLRAEFWASDDANSGIFMRCQNVKDINDENCYEANIFDQRPDPTYATGAIVKVAKIPQVYKAGGKWNTYDVTMKGNRLVVVLNGQKTVDIEDSKFASGPFALQWGRGVIKWRKVQVRPI